MSSRTIRGLHDRCPVCNSKNVEQMTRVTGYFAKVNWNKGKMAELRDRQARDAKYFKG